MKNIYKSLTVHLKAIQKKIIPDIVLYDAGVDVFADDKLGNLKLSLEGNKKT
jgi:acetoin utilization deacetylase AcuC-like enzyme